MAIPFTQYLRPDGRTRPEAIERPAEIEKLAQDFIAAGGTFEMETLRTGHVSLTAVLEGEDIAIEIVPNGPEIPPAVDKLVRDAVESWRSGGS